MPPPSAHLPRMIKKDIMEKVVKQIYDCEKKVLDLSSRMSREIGNIQRLIPLKDFAEYGLEVEVQICSGDEIILYCNGYELVLSAVVNAIREKGYVSINDFPSDLTSMF